MTGEISSREYLPRRFDVSFRSFPGSFRSIRLDGDVIVCRLSFWRRVRVCPSPEAWIEFWREMEAVRLWDWREIYLPGRNAVVYDGLRWQVAIAHENRMVESAGENAYPPGLPPDLGLVRETRQFRKFRDALQRLTGVESFGSAQAGQ